MINESVEEVESPGAVAGITCDISPTWWNGCAGHTNAIGHS